MTTIRRFEDLDVWKNARVLTNKVYDLTENQEFSRDFALRDQIRRAAISVLSNIAEGFESSTQAQFIRYLGFSRASAGEVRAQLYIASDRGYIDAAAFNAAIKQAETCSKQLARFIQYLEKQPNRRRISEDEPIYSIETFEPANL
jgi:four helix bundle protein